MGSFTDENLEEANEVTSLLSSHHTEPPAKTSEPRSNRSSWHWMYIVSWCIAIAIVSDIGEYLFTAPRVRLFESVVCNQYYSDENPSLVGRDGSVPERFCKIAHIQDKVATVLGMQLFFDSIPAILLPIPYGYLADTYGRKWFMFTAIIGCTLAWAWMLFSVGVLHLPLQYVWLSSLFFLIGGGPTTATTLLTTMVADVAPPAQRSSVFFYRFSAELIAECGIPPITAILMSKNIWIPLNTAVAFAVLAVLMVIPLPETLPISDPSGHSKSSVPDNIMGVTSHHTPAEEDSESTLLESPREVDGEKNWGHWIRQTRDSFSFVTRDGTVAALLLTFLVSKIGRRCTDMLLQYVSTRYGWSLSTANLLFSLRAGVNIILYMVVLPGIVAFALSNKSPISKDMAIGKTSITLMTLGAIFVAVSATTSPALMIIGIITYTLGTGFQPVMRGVITSVVESHHLSNTSDIGRLYALISVMEGVGSLISGPGMAAAFRLGMHWGRNWLGLPFAVSGVLFGIVGGVVFVVNVRG